MGGSLRLSVFCFVFFTLSFAESLLSLAKLHVSCVLCTMRGAEQINTTLAATNNKLQMNAVWSSPVQASVRV